MSIFYRLVFCVVLTALTVAVLYWVASDAAVTKPLLLEATSIAIIFVVIAITAFISPYLTKPPRTETEKVKRERGTVKWFNFNKGYGFVTRQNGEEIFVHFQSIRGSGRRALYEGQPVRFHVAQGDKGLQAEDVEPLKR